MPKTRHSRLQGRFIRAINEVVEEPKLAYAFPELRCTLRHRSIVVFLPNQQSQFCTSSDRFPVPNSIPLNLTAEQVFGWLKMQH